MDLVLTKFISRDLFSSGPSIIPADLTQVGLLPTYSGSYSMCFTASRLFKLSVPSGEVISTLQDLLYLALEHQVDSLFLPHDHWQLTLSCRGLHLCKIVWFWVLFLQVVLSYR